MARIEEIRQWPEEEQEEFLNFAYCISPGIHCGIDNNVKYPPEMVDDFYLNHSCDRLHPFLDVLFSNTLKTKNSKQTFGGCKMGL